MQQAVEEIHEMKQLMRELAEAAAEDAANANMRKNGRTKWNEEDYNVMVRELDRLWPVERDLEK